MKENHEGAPSYPPTFQAFVESNPESFSAEALSHYFKRAVMNASLAADNIDTSILDAEISNATEVRADIDELRANLATCLQVFEFTLDRLDLLSKPAQGN